VSWFLLFHLDSFIVTRQLSSTYRDLVSSRQLHRDTRALAENDEDNKQIIEDEIKKQQ
jgi:hypothetical protein